ncbi:MAG: thioredoxin domain-containing protein [Pseudomonadota bacterium]
MDKLKLVGVFVVALAIGGAYVWFSQQEETPAETALVVSPDSTPDITPDSSGVVEMVLGDPDAPITMVEYASYTCPHCQRFHTAAFKDIKRDYIDTGKVKFIYREVYFDRPGLWASIVARCGGEMRFFGITDMIYKQQSQWARMSDPSLVAEELRKIGRTAGMNDEQLDACLSDEAKAKTLVEWFETNAQRDGITSTPSFLIDGQKYSNMNYASFKEIFDQKLGG